MRDRLNLRAAWMLAFALSALSVLTSLAHAADLQITCTGPTQYTDGTSIPAGTAITYSLYGGLQGATKAKLATAQTCSFLRTGVAPGTQEYYVTASVANVESAASVTYTKVIPLPTPKAPTAVTGDLVAYEVRPNSSGVMTATAIGVVRPGTLCTAQTRVAGGVTYSRIDRESVDLSGRNMPRQTNPVEAWATCS